MHLCLHSGAIALAFANGNPLTVIFAVMPKPFSLHRFVPHLLAIFPLCGIILAVAHIWQPYSFWLDELISVTASQLSLPQMFGTIFEDVHPPLYQLLLWVWIRIFGDSEFAARSLSLILALSAFVYLAAWAKKFNAITRISILVFFSSSFLFAYYAQEARSYAMLLFFSTILTTQFLDFESNKDKIARIAAVCLLASLTHYFGMLLSLVVVAWILFESRKNLSHAMMILAAGSILFVWPVIQYVYGDIGTKTGGNFWIKVDGPLGTLSVIREALWPELSTALIPGVVIYAMTAIIIAALVAFFSALGLRKSDDESAADKKIIARLGFLFFCVVILTTLTDLHTPISIIRNYIILLPAAAVFFGMVISGLSRFPGMYAICVLFLSAWGAARLYDSYNAMANKWWVRENWKESSAYLVKSTYGKNYNYYFIPFEDSKVENTTLTRVNNFYVKKFSGGEIALAKINSTDAGIVRRPYAILFGHVGPGFIKSKVAVDKRYGSFSVYYPEQGSVKSTGVMLSVAP